MIWWQRSQLAQCWKKTTEQSQRSWRQSSKIFPSKLQTPWRTGGIIEEATQCSILNLRIADVPARPPSSFGQRNLEKSVSSASRSSSIQVHRFQILKLTRMQLWKWAGISWWWWAGSSGAAAEHRAAAGGSRSPQLDLTNLHPFLRLVRSPNCLTSRLWWDTGISWLELNR